jgi:hypothetical protein
VHLGVVETIHAEMECQKCASGFRGDVAKV